MAVKMVLCFATLTLCILPSLLASKICLSGDFDNQVSEFFNLAKLSAEELSVFDEAHRELEKLMQSKWPGSKVTRFGSTVMGMGTKSSDMDCYVSLPSKTKVPHHRALAAEAERLLKQSKLFKRIDVRRFTFLSVVNYMHLPTGTECDLLFGHVFPLRNSEVEQYLLNLDQRALDLATIVKIWSTVQRLSYLGDGGWVDFNLVCLVIFFLQQKQILPPVHMLQNKTAPIMADDWNIAFDKIDYRSTNNQTLYELLGEFFEYYVDFDFEKYAISTYLGYKVKKSAFRTFDLPHEAGLYTHNVKKRIAYPIILSNVVIQDFFRQNHNLMYTEDRLPISHFKYCASLYRNVKSDMFLKLILIKKWNVPSVDYEVRWKRGVADLNQCTNN